ncbi:MAG: hypothetical protein LWX83_09590 [Anaerolineae bacterium]|nr:hypothetical protein [Anaerolineae bacterium]
MKKYLILMLSIILLTVLAGCSLKAPIYEGSTEIKMLDEDKEVYVNSGAVAHDYTLYNHSADFVWSKDELADAQKRLDKSLPKDKWRLVTDWAAGEGGRVSSEWKNGDIGLIVMLVGNLDGTQINDLERRYGMSGLEPGATLVMFYSFDKNKKQPDHTATAIFKNESATQTAMPAATKTPVP